MIKVRAPGANLMSVLAAEKVCSGSLSAWKGSERKIFAGGILLAKPPYASLLRSLHGVLTNKDC